MKGPTPRHLWKYVTRCLDLQSHLQFPGGGRIQPQIAASTLLGSLLMGQLLRQAAFHAVKALVRSRVCRALGVSQSFGDDALGYSTERLQAAPTRAALAQTVRQAKCHKAFDHSRFIGLAVDGTTAGRCRHASCPRCRPFRQASGEVAGYRHHLVLVSVVGTGLTLPRDVEPYGPGDSEYAAGQRLLRRTVGQVGARFADYVVVDGEFATAPFLHQAGDLGLHVVARLKANLPELFPAAQQRFRSQPPQRTFRQGRDRVEVWDTDDFDPWESLRWETVGVLHYRQHQPSGDVVEAYGLTDFSPRQVSRRTLWGLAKARGEIENQGFNDAKNRCGLEVAAATHHHANSLLLTWLLALALTIERLYRLRYLQRGAHPVYTALQLVRLRWLSLSSPAALDTS